MIILGIETSCDETAAAIIEVSEDDKKGKLLSNVVASSLSLHSKTGGIVPEDAAREQVKYVIPVIEKALNKLKVDPSADGGKLKINFQLSTLNSQFIPPIHAIAVTVGPGLIGSLLVGVETAKTLAYVWNKPIIPVNHLIGHIYANFIQTINHEPLTINFPALALIVSGGHTDLVLLKSHGRIKWLGGTRDDAAGEAFDKIGRLLGSSYPGGPAIEEAARNGNPKAFSFPRPMIDSNDFDFSFSGLKTSVIREVSKVKKSYYLCHPGGREATDRISSEEQRDSIASLQNDTIELSSGTISDLAASVQQAIVNVLVSKTLKAAKKYKVKSIILGGGVAANQKLRMEFQLKIKNLKLKISLSVPPKNLCTDNAAMIASAAFFNYKPIHWRKITANPELYFD